MQRHIENGENGPISERTHISQIGDNMPKNPRNWQTDFPFEFALAAKEVALATLPAVEGSYPEDEAHTLRRSFYAFRDALRASVKARALEGKNDDTYPPRLSEWLDKLSVKVKPSSSSPSEYYVIFDLHPLVKLAAKKDPEAARMLRARHDKFVEDYLPSMSAPRFEPDELSENQDGNE
jgi:hypothetical protein